MTRSDARLQFFIALAMSFCFIAMPDVRHPIANCLLVWILGAGTLSSWNSWRETK